MAAVVVLYLYTSLIGHLETGTYPAQQGRYLFPVVASLAVAVGSTSRIAGPTRAGLLAALVAGVGWLLSVQVLVTGFWAGSGLGRLESLEAWSPLGWVSLVLLTASACAFWAGLALTLRSARPLTALTP